ncbi:MAG: hypothetical protein ABL917_01775 [Parcubacteria group bacterium]
MRYTIFTLFILSICFFSTIIHAQQIDVIKDSIQISISPENPEFNATVTASIQSYSTNLDKANIVWKIGGVTKKTGRGEKSFTFQTSGSGSTNISVSIQTEEGTSVNKNLTISPANVDIMWETDGYVPPFYKGKTLFSHENKITFIALPHIFYAGKEIPAKNLIYKWKNNGFVIEGDSGYGKNTYSIVGSVISRPINVEVEVTSTATNAVGTGFVTVNPEEPFVVFYKKDPLYGIEFQKALLGTVEINEAKEIAVVGVPYFFGATNTFMDELSFNWSINGLPIDKDSTQTTRVFRPKEGTSGSSRISLKVESFDKILQSAYTDFNIKFGKQTTENSTI